VNFHPAKWNSQEISSESCVPKNFVCNLQKRKIRFAIPSSSPVAEATAADDADWGWNSLLIRRGLNGRGMQMQMKERKPDVPRERDAGGGFNPLKFVIRTDLVISFVIIPLGILIGWLFSVNPFLTIPLAAVITLIVIVCIHGFRRSR
jgi:hypothetical protein